MSYEGPCHKLLTQSLSSLFVILSRTKEKIKTYLTVCVRVRVCVCVCVCSLYYFPHVSIYPFLFSFCKFLDALFDL